MSWLLLALVPFLTLLSVLGLFGSLGVNTGNNLQSLGIHKLHAIEPNLPNSKSPMWVFGTTLFILASLANFGAFGFAPAALLASLEATQVSGARRAAREELEEGVG